MPPGFTGDHRQNQHLATASQRQPSLRRLCQAAALHPITDLVAGSITIARYQRVHAPHASALRVLVC
jgi:hypothetical protein